MKILEHAEEIRRRLMAMEQAEQTPDPDASFLQTVVIVGAGPAAAKCRWFQN